MNERIKDLIKESGIVHPFLLEEWAFLFSDDLSLPKLEKFAELIVKECGQTLVDNTPAVDLVEDWDKGYDRAMNDCIHHIYEHFGIDK